MGFPPPPPIRAFECVCLSQSEEWHQKTPKTPPVYQGNNGLSLDARKSQSCHFKYFLWFNFTHPDFSLQFCSVCKKKTFSLRFVYFQGTVATVSFLFWAIHMYEFSWGENLCSNHGFGVAATQTQRKLQHMFDSPSKREENIFCLLVLRFH